jgi:acyl-coenzyme A thioesterase PaaI-like protein
VTENSGTTKDSLGDHPLMARAREGMPVGKLIGFELVEMGDGRAVVTLVAGAATYQSDGDAAWRNFV